MEDQIYRVHDRVEGCIDRLEDSNLSQQNVEALKSLRKDMLARNKSGHTVLGVLRCFQMLDEHIDFDVTDPSKEELRDLVIKINQNEIGDYEQSPWTLLDYKRAIKNFYKWHYDNEDPEILDFMSVYVKDSEKPQVDPDELMGVKEVEQMINEAKNPRDKALMAMLWDTGARISELLSLDVKDISFKQGMMGVNIRNGKNGPRKIYVVESIPLVKKYLDKHLTEDPDDPLFTILPSSHSTHEVKRQTYRSARNQIDCCADRADIPEKLLWNPHGWRRARATNMAKKGMTQPNMNAFFGWVPGSQVPKYYIRLANRDVEKAVRRLYPGLEEKKDEGPRYLGENIPEYSEEDLRIYGEKLKR